MTATWMSVDPRTGATVKYDDESAAKLEEAFQKHTAEVKLTLGGNPFTVRVREMRQYNSSGGSREVRREGPPRPRAPTPPRPQLTADLAARVLAAAEAMDGVVAAARTKVADARLDLPVAGVDRDAVLEVYRIILAHLGEERYVRKYGGDESDRQLLEIEVDYQVPAYFANVAEQSTYQRKTLSALGLRNLVTRGAEIFLEMHAKKFSGKYDDYAQREGPHKMRFLTGNAVDLDTVVLNVKRQLKDINAMLKRDGQPTFGDEASFARSDVCKQMVLHNATPLIEEFVADLKLTPAARKARRLDLDPAAAIHVATGNADRGAHAVWLYSNAGVMTFHANVPTIADVFGALLLAPFHLAKAFVLLCQKSGGVAAAAAAASAAPAAVSAPLQAALDEFFEDGISDSCFNGKWKAIEMYLERVETLGEIPIVLSQLQEKHQAVFTPAFLAADEDRSKEAAEMKRLVKHYLLSGVDPKTKKPRRITDADVDEWIKSTM